jgi:predicted dehydrogenase
VEEKQGRGTCAAYNDFREVIARDDVDAVYIATPDHWHALVTIAAARAGKHIYCQKPLTRTIAEGRAVVDAVHRHGIVFQHGTQQRYDARMLSAVSWCATGTSAGSSTRIGSLAGATCPQPPQPVPPA